METDIFKKWGEYYYEHDDVYNTISCYSLKEEKDESVDPRDCVCNNNFNHTHRRSSNVKQNKDNESEGESGVISVLNN